MSYTPELEYQQLDPHYAYAMVQSGETKEIFNLQLTGGYVAFIDRIACDWFEGLIPPTTHSKLELIIDGFTREFEYEIPINNPQRFDPPIVARNYVKWRVTNNDIPGTINGKESDGSHWYGVLVDGYLARPKV